MKSYAKYDHLRAITFKPTEVISDARLGRFPRNKPGIRMQKKERVAGSRDSVLMTGALSSLKNLDSSIPANVVQIFTLLNRPV